MDHSFVNSVARIRAEIDTNAANTQRLFLHRENAVQFMAKLSKNLQLSNITLYTGVSYLDRICKDKIYPEKTLAALAIACLLIASKVEEDVRYILTIPTMLAVAQVPIARMQILHCELFVLDRLSWNLRVSTLLHFANDYHNMGMFFDGDTVNSVPLVNIPDSVQRVTDFVRYFCDLLLMDNAEHPPSVGAASAWAAARHTNGIRPLWSPQLTRRTGHSLADLLPCVIRLVLMHSPNATISPEDFAETDSSDTLLEPGLLSEDTSDADARSAAADVLDKALDLVSTVGQPATRPASPARPPAQESPTNVTADPLVAPVAKRPRL